MTQKTPSNSEIQAVYSQLFGKKVTPTVTETKVKEVVIKVPEPTIHNHYELKGLKGEQGIGGPKGDRGLEGPQGIQGEEGPRGKVGFRGEIGPKGDKGDTGERGPQGLTGKTGEQGLVGPEGKEGPQGKQGPKGDIGPQGPAGTITYSELTNEAIDDKIKKGFWSLGGTERYRVLNATTANGSAIPVVQTSRLRVASFKQLAAGTNITLSQDASSAVITIASTGGGGSIPQSSFNFIS